MDAHEKIARKYTLSEVQIIYYIKYKLLKIEVT